MRYAYICLHGKQDIVHICMYKKRKRRKTDKTAKNLIEIELKQTSFPSRFCISSCILYTKVNKFNTQLSQCCDWVHQSVFFFSVMLSVREFLPFLFHFIWIFFRLYCIFSFIQYQPHEHCFVIQLSCSHLKHLTCFCTPLPLFLFFCSSSVASRRIGS